MVSRKKIQADRSKKPKKLIFCGLDNSGKTSIATVLSENITNLGLIKPTYLVKRNLLKYMDYEIIEHDMGGQQTYIASYFKDPERYFGETDICVFVVDVQDGARIAEAMKYFKDLLDVFSKLYIQPSIYVFLHKAERIMHNASDSKQDTVSMQNTREQSNIINGKRFEVAFCITSIFEPFSILKAFGQIVTDTYPHDEALHDIVQDLAERLDAQSVVLMDEHLMPIMNNLQEDENDEMVNHSAANIYFLKQSLDQSRQNPTKSIYVEWEDLGFSFMKFPPAPVNLSILVIGKIKTVKRENIEKEITGVAEEIMNALKSK